jgi:hypothetical protein
LYCNGVVLPSVVDEADDDDDVRDLTIATATIAPKSKQQQTAAVKVKRCKRETKQFGYVDRVITDSSNDRSNPRSII